MKAAVFADGGHIGIVERQLPEPKPGWVRLGVTATGICGSDLHIMGGALGPTKGIQPGHEIAGIIDAVGDGVTLATGTQVAVEPILGCGGCHFCHTGSANLCGTTRLFGVALPGGMAEYITVPAAALYALPDDLPAPIAALSEPMAVCVRGVRIAGIQINQRVAIIGAGSIGLSCIPAARAAGAGEIFITARYPHQQELARHLGATRVFASAEALLAELGDQHADVVIETVGGAADTLTESVQIARTGATIVMLGVFEGSPRLPGLPFFFKELTLAASNCYGREAIESDFELATRLVVKHQALLEPLVTHQFKLDQVAEAFATAADKASRSIKVQVSP